MTDKVLKKVVSIPSWAKPKGVWSVAIEAQPCRQLFISGLLAKDESGELVGIDDISAQTEQVLKNLKAVMETAGGTLQDIVRVDVYVRNISQFDKIHAVRRKYFTIDPPTSTMVEVTGLTDRRALIEITAIAILP